MVRHLSEDHTGAPPVRILNLLTHTPYGTNIFKKAVIRE